MTVIFSMKNPDVKFARSFQIEKSDAKYSDVRWCENAMIQRNELRETEIQCIFQE